MKNLLIVASLLFFPACHSPSFVGKAHDQLVKIVSRIKNGAKKEAAPAAKKVADATKEAAKEAPKVADAAKEAAQKVLPAGQPKYYDAVLLGGIDNASAGDLWEKISHAALVEKKKDVWVRITSPGGSAFAFLLLLQNVEDVKKQTGAHLTCVADVLAASAAFYLLEGVCDTRIMTDRTVLLAHGIQGGTQGNLAQMEDEMQLMRALEEMVAPEAARKMGMTKAEFMAWIYGRDRWMGPDESLKRRAVDRVASPDELPAASPTADLPQGAKDPNE